MRRYLLRRLGLGLLTLLGLTVLTFLISRLAPGGPLEQRLAELHGSASGTLGEEELRQVEELLGLHRPLAEQYGLWLASFVTLDFGASFLDHRPVRAKVWEAFRVSFLLQLLAILVVYSVAVPLGVLTAVHYGSWLERVTTLGLFLLYSVPSFVAAGLLIYFFCLGKPFDWFPLMGLRSLDPEATGLGDRLLHLVLPVTCLSYAGVAALSRYAQSGMLEVLRQDYVRTARAKGLPERLVIAKHALRNGIIPVVTLFAMVFPALLGGSVIVENIFSIPGMGRLAYDSILQRDYPTVMAVTTLVGIATLVGFLVSDLLTVWLDPRVRLE